MAAKAKKVLIVGGGFAGLTCARNLARCPGYKIELISDDDRLCFYPALYEAATEHPESAASIPLETLLADRPNVHIKSARIAHIDPASQILTDSKGKTHSYDIAVLAMGVVTTYFGVPGLDKYSYSIKSAEGAARLRDHLHQVLLDNHNADNKICVIGAGPTGVELAAALAEYSRHLASRHQLGRSPAQIELIEALPRILPKMSSRGAAQVAARLQKLGVQISCNQTVQSQSPDRLMLEKYSIQTGTVIWTAGVANHPFYNDNSAAFQLDQHHKVQVNEFMCAANNVYVLGDNTNLPYSGLAQTAVADGRYLARSLCSLNEGQLPGPRRQRSPIVSVPVGKFWALVEYGPLRISGLPGWLVRQCANFIGYWDIASFTTAFRLWRRALIQSSCFEDCPAKTPRSNRQ